MPRFAILVHDYPYLHWDFLLENGESCRSWRLLADPDSTLEISAEELPDHRRMYLDYEGPVSGNRGSVTPWDAGTFEWRVNQSDLCEVVLAGKRWRGFLRMERIGGLTWRASRITTS